MIECYLNGVTLNVRKELPWPISAALIAAGGLVVFSLANTFAWRSEQEQALSSMQFGASMDRSLIGSKLSLPVKDSLGREIYASSQYLFLSADCSGCGRQALIEYVTAAPGKTVLAFSDDISTLPQRTQSDQDIYILHKPATSVMPRKVALATPVLALLDERGTIVDMPERNETIEDFLRRIDRPAAIGSGGDK